MPGIHVLYTIVFVPASLKPRTFVASTRRCNDVEMQAPFQKRNGLRLLFEDLELITIVSLKLGIDYCCLLEYLKWITVVYLKT